MARLILIADDSPTIQRKAQKILQDQGFDVETVSNGVAAIKKLPTLRPVLVLADVSMPGKDGYEVCEFVKTSADLVHVPVLLVVSDLEPYDEWRGARVKANGIIKKPFTPQDLIAAVAKFTALGEAPLPPSPLPATLAVSPPAEVPEVPPGGPELGEMPVTPPEPLPGISLQPSPEAVPQASPESLPEPQLAAAPQDVLAGSPESLLGPAQPFPDFAFGRTPEPTVEPMPEGAPEPIWVSPELVSEGAPEAMLEPSQVGAEPSAEPMPEAAPEPTWVGPELISEAAPEILPEPSQVGAEPSAEPMPEAAPEPTWVGPELDRKSVV